MVVKVVVVVVEGKASRWLWGRGTRPLNAKIEYTTSTRDETRLAYSTRFFGEVSHEARLKSDALE